MYRVLRQSEKYIKLYDAFNIFDRREILKGLWVNNTAMSSNIGAYCYVIPCRPNTVYEVSREALTTRNIIACSTEYPTLTTTIQKTINMENNLTTLIKTLEDTKYLIIYFGVNSFAADSQVKWSIKDMTIRLNKWEAGDYAIGTGLPINSTTRQRTPSKYRFKILGGMTYKIEIPFNSTFGIRLFNSNNKFIENHYAVSSTTLTFTAADNVTNGLFIIESLNRNISVKISLTESNTTVLSNDVDDVTE